MKKAAIFLLIIVLAFFLRSYRVAGPNMNPPALFWDEASWAYNAYSINQTGKDEWGIPYPLVIKSFGDNKLPLYAYLTAAVQKITGPDDSSVRIPSIIFGLWTIVVTYFLAQKLFGSQKISFLATLFLAISMWHLQFSRVGFEPIVSLALITTGILFFLNAMEKQIWWLPAAAVCFVAALYTYHSSTIIVPLMVLVLTILFRKQLLKGFPIVLISAVLALILLVPYLQNYWLSPEGQARPRAESVLNQEGNVLVNFSNNLAGELSLDFLFFHGDQNGRHSIKKLGELYLWQLPTVLVGVFLFLRRRDKPSLIVLSWVLIGTLPAALSRVSPHSSRGLFSVWGWQMVSSVGAAYLLRKLPRILQLGAVIAVVYSLALYLHMYYVHYPKAYAADWQDGFPQTVKYLKTVQNNYDRIVVASDLTPVYFLYYLPFLPAQLQNQNHDLTHLGKFVFSDFIIYPAKLYPSEKVLVVAPAGMVGDKTEIKREIRMNNGDPVFRIYEL